MPLTEAEAREFSDRLFDKLASDDFSMVKEGAQDLTDYTRVKNREDSFVNQIIEPSQWDRSLNVPQMHTDQPVLLFEYEVASPFSVPVDFGATPSEFVPKGKRYPLTLQRMQSPAAVKELIELETYRQDLRAILADNMTKDLVAMRDLKFMRAVRKILGPIGTVLPWAGQAMYVDMASAVTHNALNKGKDVMRGTQFAIEPTKLLGNHLRKTDLEASMLSEVHGTSKAEDLVMNGLSIGTYQNVKIIFTIKSKIVPYNDFFLFGAQEYLGRYVQYMPPTMSVKKEDDMVIKFSLYEIFGMTIAHPGAVSGLRFL
jgi:hypothetical protein